MINLIIFSSYLKKSHIHFLEGEVVHGLKHTVRFKKEALPGERFNIETKIISWKRGVCTGHGIGYIKGEIICEADMMLSISTIFKKYIPNS